MERISKEELIFGLHSVREALKTKKRQVSVLYIVANKTASKQVEEVIPLLLCVVARSLGLFQLGGRP